MHIIIYPITVLWHCNANLETKLSLVTQTLTKGSGDEANLRISIILLGGGGGGIWGNIQFEVTV